MDKLNEKGFVFKDQDGRPFWVRMQGETPWLIRWHVDNKWVTHRPCSQMEIWGFYRRKITDEEADVYHRLSGLI